MGLFSKKEYVCEKCGVTFTKRINLNGNICDACWKKDADERRKLEAPVRGYMEYHQDVNKASYSDEELRQVAEHKRAIIAKYQNEGRISKAELMEASDNYKRLSDEQIVQVLAGIGASCLNRTMGAAYGQGFFVPTKYENMIVDAEDVFAVGYTTDIKDLQAAKERKDSVLCVVFTNDPYVPAFPMIYEGKMRIYEVFKSKKVREGVAAKFELGCPNLTYPVCDVKQLKKLLKQEEEVRGNLSKEFMLKQIDDITGGWGMFNSKKMTHELPYRSVQMIEEMGYIQDNEIDELLKMDKMFNRNFWTKQLDRLNKSL